MTPEWDRHFIEVARLVASRSKDPSTKVGAIIVDNEKRIVSTGYNGFPRGVLDDPTRYGDRALKYEMVIHAEANAILFSHGRAQHSSIYCTMFPCSRCAGFIIQSGIRRVVSPPPNLERWASNYEISKKMFDEANILVETFGE